MAMWAFSAISEQFATAAEVAAAQAAADAAQAAADAHASRHSLGGADEIDLADLGEFNARTRSSYVASIPRILTTSTILGSTYAYGSLALVERSGTYSNVRFCQRTAAASMTYLRAGVYDGATRALLAQTAELAGLSGLNVLFEAALDVSLNLVAGDYVILMLGGVFTGSPTFQGRNHNSAQTVNVGGAVFGYRSNINEVTVSGLPASLPVPGSGANLFPWVELY